MLRAPRPLRLAMRAPALALRFGLGGASMAAFALLLGTFVFGGCGNDAVGIETCKQVEEARCNRAAECGVDLSTPVHRGDDTAACIRFYQDECQHGLASKNDPGGPKVKACVAAISSGACSVVLAPESDPACEFLLVAPTPDAGSDAGDAADVGAETSTPVDAAVTSDASTG